MARRVMQCVLALVVVLSLASAATADDPPPSAVTGPPEATAPAADAASQIKTRELWTRLRTRLQVRTEPEIANNPERPALDPNELDPLLWSRIWFPESVDYLVSGKPYQEAVTLLDELLRDADGIRSAAPLERALLQRDLWAVFDYLSDPRWNVPQRAEAESQLRIVERRELCRRLAAAIDRLALTNDQIAKLPNNFAAAVAAKTYPGEFDAANPEVAFLPPDLWDPEGPWVLVGEWASNPLAIRHTAFFGGRSTFSVFLNLPGGREATLKYLANLRKWKPDPNDVLAPGGMIIGPPQVPSQIRFALARRMMLVDQSGRLVPTSLVEALQIRVLPDIKSPRVLRTPGKTKQTFLEFRMRRADLIAGSAAGLSVVPGDERDRSDMLELGPGTGEERRRSIMESCQHCHSNQGILSMNSFTGDMDNVSRLRGARTLTDARLEEQDRSTILWKKQQYSWGLLTGLIEACRQQSAVTR